MPVDDIKKILLIDLDDTRRSTRVDLLRRGGYQVETSTDWSAATSADEEGTFDLVIIALHINEEREIKEYSRKLRAANVDLPILLLTDVGAFVPSVSLEGQIDSGGSASELLRRIAHMLAGSQHIREVRLETT